MSGTIETDEGLRRILSNTRTIALLGASPKPERPSHGVMRFLLAAGYRVFPVNPGQAGTEILGQLCHADLSSIPEPIDMVDVFRASDALPGIVEELLALDPRPAVLWTQLGVRNSAAAERASAAGVEVVMDRCPAIEHPRLMGS